MALRVGIVGKRGGSVAAGLRSVAGVEIAALCELDPEAATREAENLGIARTVTQLDDLFELCDAIVVATPMHLHVSQCVRALNAGKHVLSEVTAAVSLEECWRLLDAVQSSKGSYMMAENYCTFHDNVLVLELVRKGFFGNPYYGEGEYLHDVKDYHHTSGGGRTWRYYWQVGQNGVTYGTHSLGPVMQWLTALDPTDRIESVVCLGSGRHTDSEHPHDDTSTMLCHLASGKLVRVRLDMLSNRPAQHGYYALQGTGGVYECSRFSGEPGRVWFDDHKTAEHDRTWEPLSAFEEHLPADYRECEAEAAKSGHGGGDYFMGRLFAQSCLDGTTPLIDVYQALEWTAAGLCSQTSIESGGVPIRVPNFRNTAERPVWLDSTR